MALHLTILAQQEDSLLENVVRFLIIGFFVVMWIGAQIAGSLKKKRTGSDLPDEQDEPVEFDIDEILREEQQRQMPTRRELPTGQEPEIIIRTRRPEPSRPERPRPEAVREPPARRSPQSIGARQQQVINRAQEVFMPGDLTASQNELARPHYSTQSSPRAKALREKLKPTSFKDALVLREILGKPKGLE